MFEPTFYVRSPISAFINIRVYFSTRMIHLHGSLKIGDHKLRLAQPPLIIN